MKYPNETLSAFEMVGLDGNIPELGEVLNRCFNDVCGEELNELLGPTVYKGILGNAYPTLLNEQLRIIAEVTGVDVDFWLALSDRKTHTLDLFKISAQSKRLYDAVREKCGGWEIKLVTPEAPKQCPGVVQVPPSDNPFILDYLGTVHPGTASDKHGIDLKNLELILAMFMVNIRTGKQYEIPLPDTLALSWGRAQKRISPLQEERVSQSGLSMEEKWRAEQILEIIIEECGKEGIREMKAYNVSVNDKVISLRGSREVQ